MIDAVTEVPKKPKIEPSNILKPELVDFIKQRAQQIGKEIDDKGIDTVVFLDKAAREFYPPIRSALSDKMSEKKLSYRFVNLGREKVLALISYLSEKQSEYMKQDDRKYAKVFGVARSFILGVDDLSTTDFGIMVPPDKFADFCKDYLTEERLVEIYGRENLDDLREILVSNKTSKAHKLIIDDLADSGWTGVLAQHIFSTLDPDSHYEFTSVFDQGSKILVADTYQYMPWSRDQHQLVDDSFDRRKFISRAYRGNARKKGLMFRKEIKSKITMS